MQRYPDRGLHGRVVEELGLRITAGGLDVGETIDTEHLAVSFDVSRTVIREALKVLAGKGLVDARPRRGTFVRDRASWNLLDPDVLRWQFEGADNATLLEKLHEVRFMVEPAAAALAAQRRTDTDVQRILAAVDAMGSSDGASDGTSHGAVDPPADTIAAHDLEFHLGLIAATHNELIEQLSTVIGIGLAARDRFVHNNAISIRRSLELHSAVAHAVVRGDPAAARARMVDLLEAAVSDVREVVSTKAPTPRRVGVRRSRRSTS